MEEHANRYKFSFAVCNYRNTFDCRKTRNQHLPPSCYCEQLLANVEWQRFGHVCLGIMEVVRLQQDRPDPESRWTEANPYRSVDITSFKVKKGAWKYVPDDSEKSRQIPSASSTGSDNPPAITAVPHWSAG